MLRGIRASVEKLPDGYDTQTCEEGQNLSNGQRQQSAITRALLTGTTYVFGDSHGFAEARCEPRARLLRLLQPPRFSSPAALKRELLLLRQR